MKTQGKEINWETSERESEGVGWIRVTQNRVQWWAFVNTIMNLRARNFLTR
jgi:hypothetical protein